MVLDETITVGQAGHIGDHNALHDEYNGVEALQRYVDPVNGLDTNNGWTIARAMKTIQAAYDDLSAAAEVITSVAPASTARIHIGEVILLPGGHDIGNGLLWRRSRAVLLRGLHSTMRWRTGGSATVIPARALSVPYLFTTGTPTQFIDFTDDSINGYGFGFRDFEMWVDVAGVDWGIKHINVNQSYVERVNFIRVGDSAADVDMTFLYGFADEALVTGSDMSWWRVDNCFTSGTALSFYGIDGTARNNNRHTISRNICFGPGTTMNCVTLHFGNGCSIWGNNFEAFLRGVLLDTGSHQNHVFGNGGESVDVFIRVEDGNSNTIIEQGIKQPDATDKLFSAAPGAHSNIVMGSSFTTAWNLYASSAAFGDDGNNFALLPSNIEARAKIKFPQGTLRTDANRGDAADVEPSTMIWNTDDGFPNWSDGTVWVDATGATT